jgi:hypothetical protein
MISLHEQRSHSRARPLISPTLLHVLIDPRIEEITKWTSTYLQKNINSDCYQCLQTLLKITQCFEMGTPTVNLSPPTSAMLFSLLKSYGRVLTVSEAVTMVDQFQEKDFKQNETSNSSLVAIEKGEVSPKESSAICQTVAENADPFYISRGHITSRKVREPNFVALNAAVSIS